MASNEKPNRYEDAAEAETVARAKQRDSKTWADWYDAYYTPLYRYAFVRLLSVEEAEDLASQVFLEALKGIDRFKYTGTPVLAWFYGIARHLVAKRRRQRSRTNAPLESQTLDAMSAGVTIEEDTNLQRIMAWTALEQLKEEHREVLILRFLVGLPSAQVARIIGKTEAATYSLQVRALEAARRALGPVDASTKFGDQPRSLSA